MASAIDVSLTIDDGEAARLTAGLHHDPHAVLGGSLAVDSAGRPMCADPGLAAGGGRNGCADW